MANLTGRLELALLRRADGIAVIHDVFRTRLVAGGVSAERTVVIPNWAHVSVPEASDRSTARSQLGWKDDDFIALHAGNMGAKQGLEGLVDVARLAETRGSRVHIALLGNGSRRASLEASAKDISRLTIMDPLPAGQFEMALQAADCLVLHEKPGVVEMSVPSKLTTYFAAGRPVVAATDPRSGAAALMAAAHAGPVVPAAEASHLLDAIEALAADPQAAASYGQNGREYASEHLTGAASLGLAESWIGELAGAHSTSRRS
jgi:glycosyltransferase involved in cell wall biosynthesis